MVTRKIAAIGGDVQRQISRNLSHISSLDGHSLCPINDTTDYTAVR